MTRALLAVAVGVALCGAAAAQTPKLPTAAEIPNFSTVAPGIYRGAAPTEAGLRALKALGVRHIIDLRIEKRGQDDEARAAQALGVARTRIRLGREAPTTGLLARSFRDQAALHRVAS